MIPAYLMTDEALPRAEAAAQAEIDAAYWRFTRCARGVPPPIAVPDAYVRRRELRDERELREREAMR